MDRGSIGRLGFIITFRASAHLFFSHGALSPVALRREAHGPASMVWRTFAALRLPAIADKTRGEYGSYTR